MSDTEDYMSDKFLEQCSKSDVRPSLVFNKSQKRALEQHKKQLSDKGKRPKTYKDQEKEVRERGLQTAISTSNVGFKLLQKMGYKEGGGLGRSSEGIKEPVPVIVKDSSSGVGRERHIEESLSLHKELKEKLLQAKEREFKQSISARNMHYILTRDFTKAQRVCEELDSKNDVKYPNNDYFWTRATMKQLKKTENEGGDDESEDSDENELPEEITDQKLEEIIDYLRERYLYCLYCGFCASRLEELQEICPGPYRPDHDDDF